MATHLAIHFRDRTCDGLCVNLLWPRWHGILGPWSKQLSLCTFIAPAGVNSTPWACGGPTAALPAVSAPAAQ